MTRFTDHNGAPARPRALDGVRVLDVTQFMAGPFCAMLLADLGADVIKVEPPSGDSTRQMVGRGRHREPELQRRESRQAQPRVEPEDRRKGRQLFKRLARSSDIVIENYRPGVMQALRAGLPALWRRSIRGSIYASISGYGQTGPDGAKGGFDLIAQGVSGIMSITGRTGAAAGQGGHTAHRSRRGAVRARPASSRRCTIATRTGVGQTSTPRSSKRASRCRCGKRPSTSPGQGCRRRWVGPPDERAVPGDPVCGRLHHDRRATRSSVPAAV